MSLPDLVSGGAGCGPVNPLQQLGKRFGQDRGRSAVAVYDGGVVLSAPAAACIDGVVVFFGGARLGPRLFARVFVGPGRIGACISPRDAA